MTEERDNCDDNERKTVRGEKETETFVQVQKQNAIEKETSENRSNQLFENQNSEFKNNSSSYAPIRNPIPKSNAESAPLKSVTQIRPFAKSSVLSKVCCYFGLTSSMSRGGLRLSGIWSVVGVVVLLGSWVGGSEFPERECCDPVYPPNTATTAAAPITPPIPKLAGQWVFIDFV